MRGTFDVVQLGALQHGLSWDSSKLYLDGTVTVIPAPSAGLVMIGGLLSFARRGRRAS